MSVIGEKIKQRRTYLEWTQEILANKMSTTKHVISNWERGVANPDHKQITSLANIFDVTTDYLLGLTEYPEPQFRDPFGQIYLLPAINYSFIQGASWDLIKVLDSGIDLSVNDEILSTKDKQLISNVIKQTIERIQEVRRETSNHIEKETNKLSSDDSLF